VGLNKCHQRKVTGQGGVQSRKDRGQDGPGIYNSRPREWYKAVVPKRTAPHPGGGGKRQGDTEGEPLSVHCLLTYDCIDFRPDIGNLVSLHQGIHCVKNLLTVKQLVNVESHFIVMTFISGLCKQLFCRTLYRVGLGTLGMSLWNQGSDGLKKFENHWYTGSETRAVWRLKKTLILYEEKGVRARTGH
jgi:hypothetical protein